MKYEKIVKGTFLSRPNRFIAEVRLETSSETVGSVVRAHVKNTGRLGELLIPGTTVYLEDFRQRMGSRKLAYSLIGLEKKKKDGELLRVNIDSQAPNKVVAEALQNRKIQLPGMKGLSFLKGEKTWGDSRFDFYLEDEEGKQGYLEVKGVTLENDGIACFPDAPTERGVKHIHGLMKAKASGYLSYIIFVVQMEGMKEFRPNDETHPDFGKALRDAQMQGATILAFFCHVEKDSLEIAGSLPVNLT